METVTETGRKGKHSEDVILFRDEDDELALLAPARDGFARCRDRCGDDCFVPLGKFARDADAPVCAENFFDVGEGFEDAVGGLVENKGIRCVRVLREDAAAGGGLGREKSKEEKCVGGQAGDREGVDKGARTRDGCDGKTARTAGTHDTESRVADRGHAGVGDEGDPLTARHALGEGGSGGAFVVFVVGDERNIGLRRKDAAGVPGVFAGDGIDERKYGGGARREFRAVPDGGAYDIQGRREALFGFHVFMERRLSSPRKHELK